MTYPSLGNLMDVIQQEDMGDKNREYFQEMAKEIKIKNDIAQKVLDNIYIYVYSQSAYMYHSTTV